MRERQTLHESESSGHRDNQKLEIIMPIEDTDLERRVLAHERILQALIRHVAEDQPAILERLKGNFSTGHNLGEYEQEYTSTRHYGDHFIRGIELAIMKDSDVS